MFSFPTSPASISTESGCIPHNPQLIEVPAAELIKLTHEEENLFNILRNCIAKNNMTTVLRVAGGWVRDKLLGKESHDIDIALDNISGQAFANILNAYLNEIGEKTRAIAVIQANPDQSKHLETANVRVLNKEIDFVNLRSETYTNTRIPEIKIGTPLEDALRRDFTINSLFYNINSNKIEDYTTRGIHDLKNGILRTPITPFITFKDDPLRVLRAIRFCSRFNFKLCKDLIAASHNNSIKNELNVKISKERIYKECDGMYGHSTSRPFLGFLLMYRLNILDVVLNLSEKLNENQRDKNKITLNSDISSSYFDKISNNLINYLNTLASNKEKINSIETIFPTNITNGKWLYTSIQILFYINILKQLEHHEPFQHVMRDPSSLTLHKVYKDSSLDFHNRHEVAEVYLGEEVEAIESIDNSNHVETIKNLQCKEQDTLEIDKDSYFFYDKDTNYDIYSNIDELKQFKHFKVSIYNQLACQNDTNLKHLHWAALTFPITHLNFLEKKKNIPLSQIVLRDSLKMEKVGSKNVEKLHEAAISFLSVASPDNIDIETAALILSNVKENWRDAIKLATAMALVNFSPDIFIEEDGYKNGVSAFSDPIIPAPTPTGVWIRDFALTPKHLAIIHKFKQLEMKIDSYNLDNIWNLKPLLDGNEFCKHLNLKPGRILGVLTKVTFLWQVRNPTGDASQLIEYLKNELPNLTKE